MYQRILLAVDGSDTSNHALGEAINLARDQQASLSVVYVVDEASIFSNVQFINPTEIENTWIKEGHEALDKAQASARMAGVNTEVKLLETENVGERIADAIVKEVNIWHADLLVAGTHGRSGLKHLLLGSVAEGLIRISPVPILLIRDK